MTARVLVLGAAGRLGSKAAEAFRAAGWSVTVLVRPGGAARAPSRIRVVEVHALDYDAVAEAARGADVVLHALNPAYPDWSRLALPLAYSAINAAETAGATLLFPGNLYNYGSPTPATIDETSRCAPPRARGTCGWRWRSGWRKPPIAACVRSSCGRETSSAADTARGSTSCSPRRSAAPG
jgi:nucleoside-diphosphate-sugar epimerase